MWPIYVAKKRSLKVTNADKHDEFKELLDEYSNTAGAERKEVKVKLRQYCEEDDKTNTSYRKQLNNKKIYNT